jgi:biotin carboxyl carrier protein
MNFDVTVNGKPWRVAIEAADTQGAAQVSVVTIRGRRRRYDVSWVDASTLSLVPLDPLDPRDPLDDPLHVDKRTREFFLEATAGGELHVITGGRDFHATVLSDGKSHQRHPHRAERAAVPVEGRQTVVASMPGRIVRVLVAAGDRVAARQAVVVVEAMKMENEMRAPKDGVVREVRVTPGAAIDAGAVLVVID